MTFKMVPKGAIFKKECKKVLFNSFVMMQFSQFDPLFFLQKSNIFGLKIKCALFYELIFFAKFSRGTFFHCKKVNGLFFTQKKSFSIQFLMGKKSVGLRKLFTQCSVLYYFSGTPFTCKIFSNYLVLFSTHSEFLCPTKNVYPKILRSHISFFGDFSAKI